MKINKKYLQNIFKFKFCYFKIKFLVIPNKDL